MNGFDRKRLLPHSPLVLVGALLWGVVELLALSRARWARRQRF
ncbi:MAG TPA: hypothetical protein VFL86_25185 [Burkholderiaceae bacterium]|nr:hypothetical protein [Burkholderiaceae bacterium]